MLTLLKRPNKAPLPSITIKFKTKGRPANSHVKFKTKGRPANSHGYDGNNDGTPDYLQPDVASLHTADGENYVTFSASGGHRLVDVRADTNPSPGDAPADVAFPYGFFEFRVTGLTAGEAVDVTLNLPAGARPATYWKYGSTPPHWYEFMYNGQTGAVITGNVVVLYFVDGQRWDDDLAADGEIIDQGGPGGPAPSAAVATVPTLSEWGMILFALVLLGSGCMAIRGRHGV